MRLLFVLLLGCAALAMNLRAARGDEEKKPIDWAWLSPGATTRTQVTEKAGAPDATFKRRIRKGVLELDPRAGAGGAFGDSPRADASETVAVEVVQYTKRGDEVHDNVLVFFGDRLLYALTAPPPDEESVTDVEKKYGQGHIVPTERRSGCEVTPYAALVYESRRFAYLSNEGDVGCIECKQRIVWPDAKAFEPDLAGFAWRLPEREPEE